MYIDSGADRGLPENVMSQQHPAQHDELNPTVDLVYLPHLVRDATSLPSALRVSNH